MVFQTLNRLKWTGQLKDCEIIIVHRGARGDKKLIKGQEIVEVKRTYFLYSESGRETFIPNHRVLEIRLGGRVIWKRKGIEEQASHRLWEVDSARGIAIMMMVLSNFLFDLSLFAGCGWCYSGFWFYFARATAVLFVLVAGISLALSFSRGREFPHFLKRGLRIFGYGLLITAVTLVLFPGSAIYFGVLHLIGLSIILAYPFLRRKFLGLAAGIVFISLGLILEKIPVGFPWLVWFGLKYPGFFSLDYTPILPWLGVFLVGVFLGNFLFPQGKGTGSSNSVPIKFLSKLGRNSLFIYLIHQPILVGIVLLFGMSL